MYEELMVRIRDGDNVAFASLYQVMKREVYVYALSFVCDTWQAEDIMQDVFVKVRRYAGHFEGGNARAWIYSITRNTALNALKTPRSILSADAPELGGNGNISTERLWLSDALDKLAEESRAIVLLHLSAGYKHREIAKLLELPLSTVKFRYREALRRLKSILGEDF